MKTDFLHEEKAQISAELIIVMAAIVAIALLFVSNIQNFATKAITTSNAKFTDVTNAIEAIKPSQLIP